MLDDDTIKRLAMESDILRLADSWHASADEFRAFGRACYAEGQRDAQVRIAELEQENERLREALERLARLGNGDQYGNSEGNMIARAALENTNG